MSVMQADRDLADISAEVEREIVRMLWTFHFATPDQISRLIWNDAGRPWRRRLRAPLQRLLDMHMLWREPRKTSPGYRSHTNGRAAGGWYYGLTEVGRAWGATRLPELTVLRCITREGYLTDPDRRTITHSGHCTEYCTRMVQRLRNDPRTVGLFFETESTVLGAHLRMDCLIRLRLYRRAPAITTVLEQRLPWEAPWLPTLRTRTAPGTLDVTFALEIDEGSEGLDVLELKALNYRRTFTQGLPGGQRVRDASGNVTDLPTVHWQQVLCPIHLPNHLAAQVPYFPIPVLVMNSDQRLGNVWRVWHDRWPNSEVRMTTWERLNRAGSVMSAPYMNQDWVWVDLLGKRLGPA